MFSDLKRFALSQPCPQLGLGAAKPDASDDELATRLLRMAYFICTGIYGLSDNSIVRLVMDAGGGIEDLNFETEEEKQCQAKLS